jgi:hypothetical protein
MVTGCMLLWCGDVTNVLDVSVFGLQTRVSGSQTCKRADAVVVRRAAVVSCKCRDLAYLCRRGNVVSCRYQV